jgi:L-fuconolactonase
MATEASPVIDTHLHFWDFPRYHGYDQWLHNQPAINRAFMPEELKPQFDACGVNKGVLIEATRGVHALNLWWLGLAEQYDFIGAMVAGLYLEADDLNARLDEYSESPYFVGIRTALAGPAATWPDNPATQRGLRELARRDLSLDLLEGYPHFAAVQQIAEQHPNLRIILDHCGNPPINEGQLDAWAQALAPLAATPNIVVKYSSLLLYMQPQTVNRARMQPVADFLVKTFGPERLLWGSNWPVELMGGSYAQAFAMLRAAIADQLTPSELAAVLGGNAQTFYKVK